MAHQYSRVGFDSYVEVNEVNLSLHYCGVGYYKELYRSKPINEESIND